MTDLNKAVGDAYSAEFGLICRDLGYEVGATLKPKRKPELFSALADLNALALQLKQNSSNPALNGFLYGVISALENPHQK